MVKGSPGISAQGRRRALVSLGIAILLLAPLIAMRFTDEVNWTAADFVAATLLLGGAALAFELVARRTRNPIRRKVAAAGIIAVAAAIWAVGAVGALD